MHSGFEPDRAAGELGRVNVLALLGENIDFGTTSGRQRQFHASEWRLLFKPHFPAVARENQAALISFTITLSVQVYLSGTYKGCFIHGFTKFRTFLYLKKSSEILSVCTS